jgi:hypothetical protein
MDMARFVEMIEEFKTLPPVHEIQRAQILLPGDKGYPRPKIDPLRAKQIVAQDIKDSGKEPEWMRNARLKAERRAGGKRGG